MGEYAKNSSTNSANYASGSNSSGDCGLDRSRTTRGNTGSGGGGGGGVAAVGSTLDILPGVGEIALWAAKDNRGYLIDNNGSWWVQAN